MSDQDWYFAQGDQEKGPITFNELTELLANGKLQSHDLVWHDGMDDWSAVQSVPELKVGNIVPNPPAPPPMPSPNVESTQTAPQVQAEPRTQRRQAPVSNDLLNSAKLLAHPLLVIGLLTVVLTRGCDQLGDRYAERLQASYKLAQTTFEDKWDLLRLSNSQEASSIRGKTPINENDQSRLQAITEELVAMNQQRTQERANLATTTWRYMGIDARDAKLNNDMWRFWRGILFFFGTILLVSGLLVMGLSRQGPEKWLALVMLAIILFSIYVGGSW